MDPGAGSGEYGLCGGTLQEVPNLIRRTPEFPQDRASLQYPPRGEQKPFCVVTSHFLSRETDIFILLRRSR